MPTTLVAQTVYAVVVRSVPKVVTTSRTQKVHQEINNMATSANTDRRHYGPNEPVVWMATNMPVSVQPCSCRKPFGHLDTAHEAKVNVT